MSSHLKIDKIGSIAYSLREINSKGIETLNVKHVTIGDLEENTGEIFHNFKMEEFFL